MRKVFLFMMVSLDGYFEGPNHDLSWHNVDEEFNDFAIAQTDKVSTLLFGRRTYELMASYWPTELAEDDPIVAKQMNATAKIVFSHTLDKADWQNTTLVKDNAAEVVRKLKAETGNDIGIYGSNKLCVNLMRDNLVDEFRIMINPVAIGDGTPLFKGIEKQVGLKFVGSKAFENGNVLLTYRLP